jgi:hypothetical protein
VECLQAIQQLLDGHEFHASVFGEEDVLSDEMAPTFAGNYPKGYLLTHEGSHTVQDSLLIDLPVSSCDGLDISDKMKSLLSKLPAEFKGKAEIEDLIDKPDMNLREVITAVYNAIHTVSEGNPEANLWTDGKKDCYASNNEQEFYAQGVNVAVGTETKLGDEENPPMRKVDVGALEGQIPGDELAVVTAAYDLMDAVWDWTTSGEKMENHLQLEAQVV